MQAQRRIKILEDRVQKVRLRCWKLQRWTRYPSPSQYPAPTLICAAHCSPVLQASVRLSEAATRNRALRDRVDSLRRERMLFEDLRK